MFLKHPAWLWLKKHDPKKIPPVDEHTQAMFDAGFLFESYAEKLFSDVTRLGFNDYSEYNTLPSRTEAAIRNGAKVILQARFEKDGYTCISDVVEMIGDRLMNLYEIKSSTSAKKDHLVDLAFQTMVIESLGYRVDKISVIHVNSDYRRQGELDVRELSAITDVTEEVRELSDYVATESPRALEVANSDTMPDASPSLCRLGSLGEYMKTYRNLKSIPEDSIFDLVRVSTTQIGKWEEAGIELIRDIPEDSDDISEIQLAQVRAVKSGDAIVDSGRIKEFLDGLEYPIYFLDYETYSSVIPLFDGQKPYQQVPFQYSMHVMREPDGEIEHFEYLHQSNSDPIVPLSEALKSQIGESGTVLAWNMGFESSCNTKMGESRPEYADFYVGVNARINDLDIPFARLMYVDARFKGSYSIKNVLPVLVPSLSYGDLEISNGSQAQTTWMKAYLDNDPSIDKEWLREHMLKYCGLDTWAMVEIFRKLVEVVG